MFEVVVDFLKFVFVRVYGLNVVWIERVEVCEVG